MPSAQRSGLSATVGLAMVLGLLLVSGTLAVSGGGILSGGGRLGVDAAESAAPSAAALAVGSGNPTLAADNGETVTQPTGPVAQSFGATCGPGAIKDANKSKWRLSGFVAGSREGFERVTWNLSKRAGSSKTGTTVEMEWMTPKEARDQFGVARIAGQRALVVTFDGPVTTDKGQRIDQLFLERENVKTIGSIETIDGEDGKVRTVVGVRGDGCAGMSSVGWKKTKKKKKTPKRSTVRLDVQTPATPEPQE